MNEPDHSEFVTDDPEILALLDFEPVPRKASQKNAWTADVQREFIARLARTGSNVQASRELGKCSSGSLKLYNSPEGESFRAAWDAAVALAARRVRQSAPSGPPPGTKPPTIDRRRKHAANDDGPLPGQMRNEFGEWEDEGSMRVRAEGARDNITRKLLMCRRHYLAEISNSAGKRAAFEILTELPIDWDAAARIEPQPDEPYHRGNMRKPDFLLTAENGWMGDITHGPNKMEALRRDLDEYLAEQGLPPVDWDSDKPKEEDE